MKILSITAQKPHSTGSGTYLTELVNAFHRMGHSQAVVAGIYPDDTVTFPEDVDFFPVRFGPGEAISFPIAGMSDVMPYVSTKYSEMSEEMLRSWTDAFITVIDSAVSSFKPDVIYCHHLFLLTAIVRERYPGIRIFGQCHGSDLRQMMNCSHLRDRIRPGIAALDHIFALHKLQKNTIVSLYGIDPAKVTAIGSGYNSEIFNTCGRLPRVPGSPVRIAYAGKLSNAKGVYEYLRVLNSLLKDGRNITATLVGGCQEPEILSQLNDLPDRITYAGMVPQNELADIFRANDIFVLPSYYEGLGLVVIEAMACGLIPITTDLPGLQDWVSSNVINHNVIYVPQPEMETVDEPTPAGKEQFVRDLKRSIECAIDEITGQDAGAAVPLRPDTSSITWEGVAGTILEFT